MDKWHEMICIDAGDVQCDRSIAFNITVARVTSVDAHDAVAIWIQSCDGIRRRAEELNDAAPMVLKLQIILIRDLPRSRRILIHEHAPHRLQ